VKLPILATGTSTASLQIADRSTSAQPGRAVRAQQGFTLWELLIVVAIIAITISMVQLSVGLGDDARDLKRVGKDLGKLFQLLSQEAVFENRNYAVSVSEQGFAVLEYNQGAWTVVKDSFFKRFKFSETQASLLLIDDLEVDISKKNPPQPHILILSSGEMTPFEWRISDEITRSGILLQGNMLGGVLMTGPEPLG